MKKERMKKKDKGSKRRKNREKEIKKELRKTVDFCFLLAFSEFQVRCS